MSRVRLRHHDLPIARISAAVGFVWHFSISLSTISLSTWAEADLGAHIHMTIKY